MTRGDERALVRIEVEQPSASVPSRTSIPTDSRYRPRRALVGFGLVLIAVLGLVLMVRPDEDEAADGTARIGIAKDIASTEKPPAPTPPPSVPLDPSLIAVSTAIDLSGRVSELVRADDGFLALDPFADGPAPPILRSADGVEWNEVETSVAKSVDFAMDFDVDGGEEQTVSWFGLRTTDTGYSITAAVRIFSDSATISSSVRRRLTSVDGIHWEPAEEDALIPDSNFLIRIGTADGATIYDEQLGDLVATQVVNEHTTIDLAGGAVCWVTDYGSMIGVSPCRGREISVDEDAIDSAVPTDQVLACLRLLGRPPVITSRAVLVDDESGKSEPFVGSEAPFGSYGDRQQISSGLIVAVDRGVDFLRIPATNSREGTVDSSVCDAIAEPNLDREPSLVILDPETLGVARVRLPIPITLDRFGLGPYVVGELTSDDGDDSRILISINNGLWAFDVETATWVELISSNVVDAESQVPYHLSESGARLYRLTDHLAIIDLAIEPDGMVSVDYVASPIDSQSGDGGAGGSIWFATDEVVFVSDFAGMNLLRRIDVPSRVES